MPYMANLSLRPLLRRVLLTRVLQVRMYMRMCMLMCVTGTSGGRRCYGRAHVCGESPLLLTSYLLLTTYPCTVSLLSYRVY